MITPELMLTVVGALVGAWAGATAAFHRFKGERAFDRRLEWHEETLKALEHAALRTWQHSREIRGGLDAGPRAVSVHLEAIMSALQEAYSGALLYARASGVKAILRGRQAIEDLAEREHAGPNDVADTLNEAGSAVQRTRWVLIRDARRHLGLRALNEPAIERSVQSQMSLRRIEKARD